MPETNMPPTTNDSVREWANKQLLAIEEKRDADGLTVISPMTFGLEHRVKVAVEARDERRDVLLVILDTAGGIVEVVERIVRVFRRHYDEVHFLVPDRAMSAGTVLAMSGDEILMDYHSCLGPIDPQVERDGRLVPALSYLSQYDDLIDRSQNEQLSTAELVLLQKLDLAELHQFELARELNDHRRWLTHGRGIDMRTLQDELKLKIQDYGTEPELSNAVWDYFWFLQDHMGRNGISSFVHTPHFF